MLNDLGTRQSNRPAGSLPAQSTGQGNPTRILDLPVSLLAANTRTNEPLLSLSLTLGKGACVGSVCASS